LLVWVQSRARQEPPSNPGSRPEHDTYALEGDENIPASVLAGNCRSTNASPGYLEASINSSLLLPLHHDNLATGDV